MYFSDYQESSGFQNCRWGLWLRSRHYLLNPNPVDLNLTCRLQGREAQRESFCEMYLAAEVSCRWTARYVNRIRIGHMM